MMKSDVKVLIVEDVEEDLKLIERILTKAGISNTKQVNTASEFKDALQEYKPDVILSDHSMPQFNSLSALHVIKERGIKVPFIVVSGNASEAFAKRCLEEGADDYILKSNLSKLPESIDQAIKGILTNEPAGEIQKPNADDLIRHNKELETFIYHISHNLRSPLTSMLGLVHLIKQSETPGSTSGLYIDLLESSIHKLDLTLKELLDYIKNSKDDIRPEKIDFMKLIEEQFERMKFAPGAERIRRQTCVEGDHDFYCDQYRLSVVLNNLISNAIKYHDQQKDEPLIKVTVKADADKATITCSDNGIGISAEHLPKVFNMFFRGTSKSEGAGLGLYIVREAIAKLNGDIKIESNLGEGTTFTITIPNVKMI
jgi:signal transduction histidine kinase